MFSCVLDLPECVSVEDLPQVVDVQFGLDVLFSVKRNERRFVALSDEVECVTDLFRSSRLPVPVLTHFPGEPFLTGQGWFAEMVFENPLWFSVEFVRSFRDGRDGRIAKLHPLGNVRVTYLVVLVGVVTSFKLVRLELVKDRFRRTFLLSLFAPTALTFFVVFIFEVTFVFLKVLMTIWYSWARV